MKKHGVRIVMLVLGLFAMLSCNQDPIFYIISNETAPKKPRIEGAPTNMVLFNQQDPDGAIPIMYVASGKLHCYAQMEWDLSRYQPPRPEGKIISLAVIGNRLFALCMGKQSANATLRYTEHNGSQWSEWIAVKSNATDYPVLQSMYADPDATRLFAGARNSGKYAILYLADDNTLQLLQGDTEMLSGVACRTQEKSYYLSTKGDGIFRVEETDTGLSVTPLPYAGSPNTDARKKTFMGMIKLNDTESAIIAVERDGGALYTVNSDSFAQMKYTGSEKTGETISTGKYATGALALWEDHLNSDTKMFIAGIQGSLYSTVTSSYTHGYVEFDLTADGSFRTDVVRRDSGKLKSVNNTDRYSTSLGKRPINHLFQTPRSIDQNMPFFASTQTSGLWSYRHRNGGWQWNAEE